VIKLNATSEKNSLWIYSKVWIRKSPYSVNRDTFEEHS
jgi:hypothetical protein